MGWRCSWLSPKIKTISLQSTYGQNLFLHLVVRTISSAYSGLKYTEYSIFTLFPSLPLKKLETIQPHTNIEF